jgi:hypothetical protein
MGKYDGLGAYLRQQYADDVPISFAEIERLTGTKLPSSAYRHRPWWSNNASNSVMTKVWLDAGFRSAEVDMEGQKLVFKRAGAQPRGYKGMDDDKHAFRPAESANEKKQNRHPLIGSMKDTFTIEPGYDLTSPMYSDEEWAEIEKEMAQDWDVIEQGMSGKTNE